MGLFVLSLHVLYPLKCPSDSSHDLSLPTPPDVCYSTELMWPLGGLSPPFSLVSTKHLVRRLVRSMESHSECPLRGWCPPSHSSDAAPITSASFFPNRRLLFYFHNMQSLWFQTSPKGICPSCCRWSPTPSKISLLL